MLLFDDSKRLEKALGEEAASVIAHVLERADENWKRELATKADLIERTSDLRVEMQAMRNDLIERMAAMKNELIRWTVGSFVAFAAFFFAAMSFLR